MNRALKNSVKSQLLSSFNPLRWGEPAAAGANSPTRYLEDQAANDQLIETAAQAVEQAMATIFRHSEEVPFCRPTDLAALPEADQACIRQAEIEQYKMKPELSAVHFCLTSVTALLEITQTLLTESASISPQARERKWKNLAEEAKVAGRAAYRAVLILSDPARAGASAD